ncbi:MAG: DUF4254 domain-containing protein [Nitrospinae bacterium]|nr:DUF4254 domain-containing protein [Nitrospinota bacterium]
MAETLGSLVDKLSIKNLRLWHMDEAKDIEGYEEKRKLVLDQRDRLIREIDAFTAEAVKGNVVLREEKVKLYNKPEEKGLFHHLGKVGEAVDQLAYQNILLWHLEDRIREEGLPDAGIAQLKREIDKANQKRNDLIDKIDELFEREIKFIV